MIKQANPVSVTGPRHSRTEPTSNLPTVVVMCFGTMMTFLQITSAASVLSAIQDDLRVSPAGLVWVPSAYTLPVAALILAASTLGNRLGRRRLFHLGTAIITAGALTVILAHNFGVVIAGQLLSGVGGALILPNSLAILGATFTDTHRRTEVVTAWAASSGIGLALGPLFAGVLLNHFSWHAAFLPTLLLGAITVGITRSWVAESRGPATRLDMPGVILGTLALAAPVYAVIEGSHGNSPGPRILAAWAVTIVAVVAFIAVERHSQDPMLNLKLFRSRSFGTVIAVAAVSLFGFTGVAITQALFLVRVQRLSVLAMGWRMFVLFSVYIVVAGVTGRLVRQVGFKLPLFVGLVLGGVAALGLTTQHPTTGFSHVWPYFALFGAACGLVAAPSTAAALASVPTEHLGAASGVVNSSRQFGSVLGSSLLGALLVNRLTATLPDQLARFSVPPQLREAVETAVAEGRTGDRPLPPAVQAAIGEAFTIGVNAAMVAAAVVYFGTAVLVMAFVRNRPHDEAQQQAPPLLRRIGRRLLLTFSCRRSRIDAVSGRASMGGSGSDSGLDSGSGRRDTTQPTGPSHPSDGRRGPRTAAGSAGPGA